MILYACPVVLLHCLSCLVSDLMMVSSSWLELLIIDTYCCCSNVRDVSLNKRPMPRTYTQTSAERKQHT
jgi:hypothetical protein